MNEAPGSGRCWDYRYCWLRGAVYTLDARRLLGQFDERQAFSDYRRTRFGNWSWQTDDPVHGSSPVRFARHSDGRTEHAPGQLV